MCGFAGEHRPGGRANVAAAERMATTMARRGPDGSGSWSAGPVALAHRRLKILDHALVELAAACPPALKLAQGGKGVLKEAARRVLPAAVIDRPKGYFPVPQLSSLEGEALEFVRYVMTGARARDRGLFRREYVDRLLAEPHVHETTLQGSELWQVAVLELWLQRRGL